MIRLFFQQGCDVVIDESAKIRLRLSYSKRWDTTQIALVNRQPNFLQWRHCCQRASKDVTTGSLNPHTAARRHCTPLPVVHSEWCVATEWICCRWEIIHSKEEGAGDDLVSPPLVSPPLMSSQPKSNICFDFPLIVSTDFHCNWFRGKNHSYCTTLSCQIVCIFFTIFVKYRLKLIISKAVIPFFSLQFDFTSCHRVSCLEAVTGI